MTRVSCRRDEWGVFFLLKPERKKQLEDMGVDSKKILRSVSNE